MSIWPTRLSPLYKSILFLVFLGVVAAISLTCLAAYKIATFVHSLEENELVLKTNISKAICETPGCIHAASSILKNMDLSIDPCDNFYQFACGNYIKETTIPDEKSKVNTFNDLNDKLQMQLRHSIENEIKDGDPRAFKLLNSYYKVCTSTDQIDKTSENDFLEILKVFGGWPVLEGKEWNEINFDWIELTYKLRNTGYSIGYFIEFKIDIDQKDSSKRVIYLDQASLGIAQEYLSKGLKEKSVKAYYKFMVDVAEIFKIDRAVAENELAEALEFEISLAKISQSNEERRDKEKLYNPMTVENLQIKYPGIQWLQYIDEILKPHTQVNSTEIILVKSPSYLESFTKLIGSTSKRTLANYAMWRVALESAPMLSERVRKAQKEFFATFTGTKVEEPRWKECVTYASNNMYLATSALYARKHFDESSKDKVEEMTQNILESFRKILVEVDWMDEKTKTTALEKLDAIRPQIAYPAEFLDDDKLYEYYKDLVIHSDSFLKSKLSLNLILLEYELDQLRKPVNKTDWVKHGNIAIVNAFYSSTKNSIFLPAGILQGAFFSNDRPEYLNYGAIGWVMGHEMTHGFDDVGRQYNKDGNLMEWWEPETKQKYLENAQCFIDQYSNFTVKDVGLNLNGKKTLGENIADNGGMKEAYSAYKYWEEQNGRESRLPGLPYTSQQMFWISMANVWCAKFRPETLRNDVITNVHSPGEFRVIGPLSNMPEFSSDYKCPVGSNMNPEKKCSVW